MPKTAEQIATEARLTVGYYVELARMERAKAIAALDSARRDRLRVARVHWRTALAELERAKFERNWTRAALAGLIV